ncbi:Rrf2 family transcriptional regulator [Streptomyces parvulus]|uniref:Rrf2 family transcriptional regulator n=1 Tax=Streptomyces parvulus TaxID=146923 RepID=A0A191V952_9ACTN|nr:MULTISPECIES: Rrf2 family transcriptional regulator [Streptomyces]ANJ11408.1 Rrf2 family transcriptional regulator [Streptomyces parvulus]MCC9152397.1 Rrf2 family transcriptional regulator [Streptomyces parvulus]MCE7685716.1 Rrf2 family transcriptional regulator [Streptomyces parvulus]MCQ4197318.1 Rrf2 family transcriptional regulator [Streptomyces parvulus]WML80235.1 Rrf2 family transcriptional regulator [Streptomyces sp. VNUA74]
MRISARADYAVRAVLELAVQQEDRPVKAEDVATVQDIPHKFLEGILGDLRRGGIVESRRGGGGGYRLAREASAITVADVIRAVDGPIVSVRGERPTGLVYTGTAGPLLPLWVALRANVRRILEGVTIADLAAGTLPDPVRELAAEPAAWENPRATRPGGGNRPV